MSNYKKIIITGAESSGKSTLCKQLAEKYNSVWIPEYARYYLENKSEEYRYKDIEHIARTQFSQFHKINKDANEILFFDTGLIITKIWFDEVFGKIPVFLEGMIQNSVPDLFLLCKPDIDWVADSVRENGGEKRKYLFNR